MALASSNNHHGLLDAIDKLIAKYSHTHPDLVGDLVKLRQDLLHAHKHQGPAEWAAIAFRVATWVKFIYDHL